MEIASVKSDDTSSAAVEKFNRSAQDLLRLAAGGFTESFYDSVLRAPSLSAVISTLRGEEPNNGNKLVRVGTARRSRITEAAATGRGYGCVAEDKGEEKSFGAHSSGEDDQDDSSEVHDDDMWGGKIKMLLEATFEPRDQANFMVGSPSCVATIEVLVAPPPEVEFCQRGDEVLIYGTPLTDEILAAQVWSIEPIEGVFEWSPPPNTILPASDEPHEITVRYVPTPEEAHRIGLDFLSATTFLTVEKALPSLVIRPPTLGYVYLGGTLNCYHHLRGMARGVRPNDDGDTSAEDPLGNLIGDWSFEPASNTVLTSSMVNVIANSDGIRSDDSEALTLSVRASFIPTGGRNYKETFTTTTFKVIHPPKLLWNAPNHTVDREGRPELPSLVYRSVLSSDQLCASLPPEVIEWLEADCRDKKNVSIVDITAMHNKRIQYTVEKTALVGAGSEGLYAEVGFSSRLFAGTHEITASYAIPSSWKDDELNIATETDISLITGLSRVVSKASIVVEKAFPSLQFVPPPIMLVGATLNLQFHLNATADTEGKFYLSSRLYTSLSLFLQTT